MKRLRIVGWVLLILAGFFAIGFEAGEEDPRAASESKRIVSPSHLNTYQVQFLGEDAVVEGTIYDVFAPRAFIVGNQGALVVSKDPISLQTELREGNRIRVLGKVCAYDVTKLEARFGIALNEEQLSKVAGRPVIVVQVTNMIFLE